ncbi:MAG TPA: FAD-dependent oxidoreductase [Xanthobacteraceae bacterium]
MTPMVAEVFDTPIVETFDVIVAGGGASGLIAAVAAARLGAKTLLLERQGCLGGTATTAYVGQYLGFFNHDTQAVWGIPFELTERIKAAGGSDGFGQYHLAEAAATPIVIRHFPFNPEIVKIVADEMAQEAGIRVLMHAQVVGVVREGGSVKGVIVEAVSGRTAYAARVVIDATGDAVVAHRAQVAMQDDAVGPNRKTQPNALCFRLSNVDVQRFRALPREVKRSLALKGLGSGELFWESMSFCSTPAGTDAICLMSRISGKDALDDIDASDQERIGRAQIKSIVGFLNREVPGFERAILAAIGARAGVRETRRICGQHTLTADEILAQRRFEDAVALGCGPMDIHEPDGTGIALSMPPAPFEIPMRCLVPTDVEGLIVTGRAISATHEANGGARHMATAMALGQAAGVMAAASVNGANSTLAIPIHTVRDALRAQRAALSVEDCKTLAS